MKICKAIWENHPILGNLELDFLKADGTPYSIIVLAGENGTGKTSVLDSLHAFCNFVASKYLKRVVLVGDNGEVSIESTFFESGNGRGFRATKQDGSIESWDCARGSNSNHIGQYPNDPRNDGTAYSSAQSVYQVGDVDTISANELDKLNLKESKREYSPQELKQLLIDISAQDNADYAHKGEEYPDNDNKVREFEQSSRLYRFKRAFNDFFLDGIKFHSIKVVNGKHEVLFQKNNKNIPIGNLSTGESQIVFRGGSLLKNIGNLNNNISVVF